MEEFSKDQFVERTQDHLNKYITAADQKASILLTGQLAFLGLLATAAGDLVTTVGGSFYYLSIGTVVAGIIAAFLAIVVIYPRTPSPEKGFIYWGNITEYASEQKFRKAFDNLSESDLIQELMIQNYMLARVADEKYEYLRWSLRVTVLMIFLASASGVVYLT